MPKQFDEQEHMFGKCMKIIEKSMSRSFASLFQAHQKHPKRLKNTTHNTRDMPSDTATDLQHFNENAVIFNRKLACKIWTLQTHDWITGC